MQPETEKNDNLEPRHKRGLSEYSALLAACKLNNFSEIYEIFFGANKGFWTYSYRNGNKLILATKDIVRYLEKEKLITQSENNPYCFRVCS